MQLLKNGLKRFVIILSIITIQLHVTNAQSNQVIEHWPHKPYEKKNDTRFAGGLNQTEVFALHQELRDLVDINKAPSQREMEIWKKLQQPQWGAFPYESVKMVDGEIKKNGHMSDELWGLGSQCMQFAINLYRFNEPSYLPYITQYADVILSSINDESTGFYSEEDGARPSLFIRLMPVLKEGEEMWKLHKYLRKFTYENPEDQAKHDELIARPQVCEYEFLFQGHALQGVANAIVWILDHPEVHHKKASLVPGIKYQSGNTYLEKAQSYLLTMKKIFDYMEQQRYFDKELGVWMNAYNNKGQGEIHVQKEDGTWSVQYRASPLNRYMIFNNAYLVTGVGLNKLDPENYGLWYQRAKHVAKRGFDFWRNHMVNSTLLQKKHHLPETNKYGKLYYWAYSADYNNTEDHIHLAMELEAMMGMNRWEKYFSIEDLSAISNMTFSQLYDYDNHCGFKHISGKCGNVAEWHKVASPWYGALIGKYMPDDAYEKFMQEQLSQWDIRLQNKELNRSDVYRMPFEILEARLNRFAQDYWLKLSEK